MKHRSLTSSRLAIALLACGAAACALDPSGAADGATDASSATTSTPIADARAGGDDGGGTVGDPGAIDATIPGSDSGATPTPDAAAAIDAAIDDAAEPGDVRVLDPDAAYPDAGDPCDLDQDGHRAATGECGGDDCCDYDGRAFKGETGYFDARDACGSFDFDCDGSESPETGTVSCKLGFFVCGGDGFKDATACGASGTFESCNFAVVTCTQSSSTRTQRCR